MSLRWERAGDGNAWWGYSGELLAASVVQSALSGRWHWNVSGVHMKWIGAGNGERQRLGPARQAADRAWNKWLQTAALTPKES